MKKIVMIGHEPLTKRTKSIFYIEDFIQACVEFEYWDISQYIFPGMQLIEEVEAPYIRKFSQLWQVRQQLMSANVDNIVFIIEVRKNWQSRKFYKLLSDHHCFMVRIDMYGNTVLNISLWQKLKNVQLKRIVKMLSNRLETYALNIYKTINKVKDFDVVFSSSSLLPGRIPINHPDYEKYFENRSSIKGGYAVFLDIYYPLHPDLLYMRGMKAVSPLSYQESLRTFFDKVEDKYGIPVVIAAHPKAKYVGSEFGDRKIVQGETSSLVKDANMVLLHTSNSVSYSILYDKPMALITNKEYCKNRDLSSAQKKLSISLRIPIFDIDHINMTDFNPRKLRHEERNEYIYSYLTSKNTEMKRNKDILLGKLLKM